MDESDVQKLIRAEARAQLIVAEHATALIEAEERVELLQKQLKASTADLKDIRKGLMTARVSYKSQA